VTAGSRSFALISADVLDQVIGAWLHTRATQAGGRLVIAVDGKAVRGARNREEKAPHLVAALAHGIGADAEAASHWMSGCAGSLGAGLPL
jgi:hypothetical protein